MSKEKYITTDLTKGSGNISLKEEYELLKDTLDKIEDIITNSAFTPHEKLERINRLFPHL